MMKPSNIPDNLFLESDKLYEVMDVFFVSYQPGVVGHGRVSPVIRNGIVSLMNEDKTFYIDAGSVPRQ